MQIRIDKYLSQSLTITRKEAHDFIKKRKVEIDGKTVTDIGYKFDGDKSKVICNGEPVNFEEYFYYMLNKPDGYISSTEDMRDPTIMELLPEKLQKQGLFPVGRLDKDTVGLLILTNDGNLAHFLLSPKHHVDKKYYVISDKPMEEADIEKFKKGIDIGEEKPTLPAKLEICEDKTHSYTTVCEGKFHQVKRMYEKVGKTVTFLERVEFAEIKLDTTLERGEYRKLTDEEILSLKKTLPKN